MTPAAGRRRRMGFVAGALIVVASLVMPTLAWAKYRVAGSETNVFATHVLVPPARPTCSGLGVLSVTLNWIAPSDSTYFTSYELGRSTTSGSGYVWTNMALATSANPVIQNGNQYFVVRTVNQLWRGVSPEQRVNSVLNLVVTCP